MIPTPFRVTPEDLGDAKIGQAIGPLMDSLNLTLNDVCSILTGGISADNLADQVLTVPLVVDVLADAFPLTFSTPVKKPRVMLMTNCVPKDPAHSLATPFVAQAIGLNDKGQVSVPAITGVLASNSYTLTFWIRA